MKLLSVVVLACALAAPAPLHSEPATVCPNRTALSAPGEPSAPPVRAAWLSASSTPSTWSSASTAGARSCLACHDGSVAADIDETPRVDDGVTGDHGHPVGIDYRAAWMRNRATLRDPADVARILPLPGGQVECVSCHAPGSADPAQLARPLRQSALCFACHTM